MLRHSAIVLLLCCLAQQNVSATFKVVCYYQSWASYGGYNPSRFDANLCTHINYAFIGLDVDGNIQMENEELDKSLLKSVAEMKTRNTKLKTLLSVGGGIEIYHEIFATIANDTEKRSAFIKSSMEFIRTHNFDGMDLDWEYPEEVDKENYIILLTEVKNAFKEEGWLLTTAVTASPDIHGFDVPEMDKVLDFMNVMTYDFYGPWTPMTGQTSALFPSSIESEYQRDRLNIASTAKKWVDAGASLDKLVIGTAFYGRSFTLEDPQQNGLHAPTNGTGVGDGIINYREFCKEHSDGWTRVWDDEQKNPYRYKDDQWYGYDDSQSIAIKTNYIKDQNYGGMMIWSMDADDILGVCGEKQILLKTIYKTLHNHGNFYSTITVSFYCLILFVIGYII